MMDARKQRGNPPIEALLDATRAARAWGGLLNLLNVLLVLAAVAGVASAAYHASVAALPALIGGVGGVGGALLWAERNQDARIAAAVARFLRGDACPVGRMAVPALANAYLRSQGTERIALAAALVQLLPRCAEASGDEARDAGAAAMSLLRARDADVVIAALNAIKTLAPEGALRAVIAYRLRPMPLYSDQDLDLSRTPRPGSKLDRVLRAADECIVALRRKAGPAVPAAVAPAGTVPREQVDEWGRRLLEGLAADRRRWNTRSTLRAGLWICAQTALFVCTQSVVLRMVGLMACTGFLGSRLLRQNSKATSDAFDALMRTKSTRTIGPLAVALFQGEWGLRQAALLALQRRLPHMREGDLDGQDPACGAALLRLLRVGPLALPALTAIARAAPPGARARVEALRANPGAVIPRRELRDWRRIGRAEPGSSLAELFAAIDACLEALAVHERRGALRDSLLRPAAQQPEALVRPAAEGASSEEALVRPLE